MTNILKVRSIARKWQILNSTRPFVTAKELKTLEESQETVTSSYLTKPEVQRAWQVEEFLSFKHISESSWIGLFLWSSFWWAVWANFIAFVFLICISAEKEASKVRIPNAMQVTAHQSLASAFEHLHKTKRYLEGACYKRILSARENLLNAKRWFNIYAGIVVTSTLAYYLQMGRKLGLSNMENVKLSIKRLIRRRNVAWHLLAYGYCYVVYANVNAFYDTYILTPQFRGLADHTGKRRELTSAYGGKGIALGRIMQNRKNIVSKDEDSAKLGELATQVALHSFVPEMKTEVYPVRSPLFTGNWGFKYRTPEKNDQIPARCWFRSAELLHSYNDVFDKQRLKEQKRKQRAEKTKQIQTGTSEKKAQTKKGSSSSSAQGHVQPKFQVGKCFGAYSADERFLKASQLNINTALLHRLKAVDLLVMVNHVTDKVLQDDISSFKRVSLATEYLNLLPKFLQQTNFITSPERNAACNGEDNCLCNYFAYFGGYFKF